MTVRFRDVLRWQIYWRLSTLVWWGVILFVLPVVLSVPVTIIVLLVHLFKSLRWS
jgi:hypothetical protein